ncbi:hypothetical protein J1N35_040754 [Gossypium stocksii]|uniref:Uncharacterized protein n=1 Tax=Gossypium stocksii TaxID=47602 RepID=A0A9D3ZIK4_9ROSI|nr:hypothetical protein J1N35_040754 [Gossypium stocksii]
MDDAGGGIQPWRCWWVENEEDTESNVDPIREPGVDGLEIELFSKPESVPTKIEDRGSDSESPHEDTEEDSYYFRHVMANYCEEYESEAQFAQVINMGYKLNKHRLHEMLENLLAINNADGSRSNNEHMTKNLMEYINFVLKGTHHLLITSIVKETYFHLAKLFPKRAEKYVGRMKGGHVWCEDIMKEIREGTTQANCMHSVCDSHEDLLFQIWSCQYGVDLRCWDVDGTMYIKPELPHNSI